VNWTYPAVAAVLALCACAAPHRSAPKRSGPPAATGTPAPAAGMSARPTRSDHVHPLPTAGARDGGHVAACRDGDCEVTVRSGTKIPLSRRFGMGPITVTVDGEDVGLRAHAPDTDMSDTVTAPGTVTLNDITVDVIDAHDDVTTLRISHH
jgi:hypothetical protein